MKNPYKDAKIFSSRWLLVIFFHELFELLSQTHFYVQEILSTITKKSEEYKAFWGRKRWELSPNAEKQAL